MDAILQKAIEAIRAVFGDVAVPPEVTKQRLEVLLEETQSNLDALGS